MNHFTPVALARLLDHYTRMQDCGPLQRSTMRALLHACSDAALGQLADAEIPHLSEMAAMALAVAHNPSTRIKVDNNTYRVVNRKD